VGIPIDIPGLDVIIPEVGEGRTVLVESGADLTNSFLVRRLSLAAMRTGHPVTFVTSRDAKEVRQGLMANGGDHGATGQEPRVVEADVVRELASFAPEGGLLAVDSFSFLTIDLLPQALAAMLRELHAACRSRRSTAVLTTDRGMFESRAEAIAIHIADGYLQFHTREGNDGLVRFLRIPKWTDGKFFDRNIYYEFDGKRLAIDLRSRVL
jgi:KaiC/GvpD/RAD55 family RecA-like ATPase